MCLHPRMHCHGMSGTVNHELLQLLLEKGHCFHGLSLVTFIHCGVLRLRPLYSVPPASNKGQKKKFANHYVVKILNFNYYFNYYKVVTWFFHLWQLPVSSLRPRTRLLGLEWWRKL